jgi:hypothetical protein
MRRADPAWDRVEVEFHNGATADAVVFTIAVERGQENVRYVGVCRTYEVFSLRSAQRFFIANDKRLRPSGVRPLPRLSPVTAGGRGAAALIFLTIRDEFEPSSSAIARLSRSLSCFKSMTIPRIRVLRTNRRRVSGQPGMKPSMEWCEQ